MNTCRCVIHNGERTVFGLQTEGMTIAASAKRTAMEYAKQSKLDIWSSPVVRVTVYSERRDELDIRLGVEAEWINPRAGSDAT